MNFFLPLILSQVFSATTSELSDDKNRELRVSPLINSSPDLSKGGDTGGKRPKTIARRRDKFVNHRLGRNSKVGSPLLRQSSQTDLYLVPEFNAANRGKTESPLKVGPNDYYKPIPPFLFDNVEGGRVKLEGPEFKDCYLIDFFDEYETNHSVLFKLLPGFLLDKSHTITDIGIVDSEETLQTSTSGSTGATGEFSRSGLSNNNIV